MIGAKVGHKTGSDNVLEAEAVICREALLWIKDKGLANIIFESDSQLLVRAINTLIFYSSSVSLILQDCMYLLNSLNGCAIVFANRLTNQAAHELSKVAVSLSDLGEWSCTPPHFLSDIIRMDLFRINTISICQKRKKGRSVYMISQ